MPKALSAAEYIHEGIWTNWERGRVLGSTLTVNPYHASLVSPALAVLISVAGAQLWRLFQYALHQSRATSSRRNFLFHQQQVSLRNTTTDLNALWRLFRLTIAWRHQRDVHAIRDSLPLILWTFFHLVLMILAGLFASSLLSAGEETLSISPWCGWYNQTYIDRIYATGVLSDEAVRQAIEYENNINSIYASIQQHVDICSASVDGCSTLPVNALSFNSSVSNGECPFEESICHPNIDGLISFDTGYLSSSSDLGFNALRDDRVSFRMTGKCAPLDDMQHVSGWQDVNATLGDEPYQIADAWYGRSSISERNATYSAIKQYLECEQRRFTVPYVLSAQYAAPGGSVNASTATFDPIPELQSSSADTGLIMLNFIGAYQGPVSDPWFLSTQPINETNTFCDHQERTLYTRDLPITTIGCTQQWQVCNKDARSHMDDNACTPLVALSQLKKLMEPGSNTSISLNPKQRATVNRLTRAANGAFFHQVISHLSQSTTAPLQARYMMSRTISLPLAANQWQIETQYWFSLLLAYLQQVSLQISTGQFAASTDYINITRPSSFDLAQDAAYQLCQNQIILSDTYQNFNFFALMLTVVICVLIIFLGLAIEDIIGLVRQHRFRFTGYNGKQDMWILNSDLEMLKVMSETKSGTVWTRSKNGIPLAAPGCTASISNLESDSWEVEEGKGVVHKRTKIGAERQWSKSQIRSNAFGSHGSCTTFNGAEAPNESTKWKVANNNDLASSEPMIHQHDLPREDLSISENRQGINLYRPAIGWGVLPRRLSSLWLHVGRET